MKKIILLSTVLVLVAYFSYDYGKTSGRIEVASGEQICLKDHDQKYYCEKMSFGVIDGDSPFYKNK